MPQNETTTSGLSPTLLVLAAGMGSRYGGFKQIDGMGPCGEWLLEYAIHDALRAGFGKIVFVVGRGLAEAFKETWEQRFSGRLPVELAIQDIDDVPEGCLRPAGRDKPLGTGHAIWSARKAIDGPFAVINADDFYGKDAFETMAGALANLSTGNLPHTFTMIAYPLSGTLSKHGRVSRGICDVTDGGILREVTEHTHIECQGDLILSRKEDGSSEELAGDLPVSMNLWGFTPDIFGRLEEALQTFLASGIAESGGELYIPFVVDELIQRDVARVEVHKTQGPWFGVTYSQDKARVHQSLRKLVEQGQYPDPLWNSNSQN
jgi:NDP-sugar pyrophosphorylase family protein